MISVIVPAHDEEASIERCIRGLTGRALPGEVDVIVVCNGCRDGTARIAKGLGPCVRVIETPIASKSQALNLGDAAARHFPRFYIDADVQIDLEALHEVARVLRSGACLAAAPRMSVDLADRSWAIRAFYEVWTRRSYVAAGMVGSGVYALSEAGRARFDRFPDIISDDGYVRLQFAPHERRCVDSCCFRITPPRTLRALVAIKTRTHKGNFQLRQRYPELLRNEASAGAAHSWRALLRPRDWPKLAVYGYVMGRAKLGGYLKNRTRRTAEWERDEESRAQPRVR